MKHLLILCLAGLAFASCNDNTTQENKIVDEVEKPADSAAAASADVIACYTGNTGKDSVLLTTRLKEGMVTGQLDYRFYQKDKNSGIINGYMQGDTLLADYHFQSEGVRSTRQIAFVKKGNQMLEGYGDQVEKGGRMVFKDLASLQFGKGFTLKETACK